MRLLASKARKEGWQKQVAWIKLKCFFCIIGVYICICACICISWHVFHARATTGNKWHKYNWNVFSFPLQYIFWQICGTIAKLKVKRWNWDDKEGTPFFVFFLSTCFLSFSLFAMTAWQWDCDFWCDFCIELRERLKSIWERIGGGHHFSFYQANTT